MKFLIDKSPKHVERKNVSELVMGQLLTPLTGYSDWQGCYAIDNGAFSGFQGEKFKRMIARQEDRETACLFVTCPDIVGAGQRSIELFNQRDRWIPEGWRVALVAQDGMESLEIPWSEMDAVFIGGNDPWKDSAAAADIVKTAKILGVWVHVGRVNTPKRFKHFRSLGADSCDGSGVAQYDWMIERIEQSLADDELPSLFDGETNDG
jgi:hypothetical protein